MRTIILADNQAISKEGLRTLIGRLDTRATLTEAREKKELIALLTLNPQAVVILDYALFDFTGPQNLVNLRDRYSGSSWLLFSDELSDDFIRLTVVNNDFGLLLKECTREEILSGLQNTFAGHRYICNSVSNQLLSRNHAEHSTENLTPTEIEVLKLISLGKSSKEIASIRHLSPYTVNTHRKNIFRKIGVNNMHEATKYALRAGIIDVAEYCI